MRGLAFALFSVSLSTLSASAQPVFMSLGELPGGSSGTRANAISADGQPIVGDRTNPSKLDEAFVAVIQEPLCGGGVVRVVLHGDSATPGGMTG